MIISCVKACDDKRRTFKLDCINGIRIFELFVILDNLSKYDLGQASQTKKSVLERCMKNQLQIWNLLKKNCAKLEDILPYPKEKIVDLLINLLNSIYIFYPYVSLEIDVDQLKQEANILYKQFCRYANVPFRDSTIKNMAIDIPELYGLDNIVNDEREAILREAIRNLIYADNFDNFDGCKIVDFDFSSCKNLTSQYDDFIGLTMHERTYNYETELEVLKQYKDNEEFFYALFVRYLRFAGRKRMYRLLNPSFHRIRFRYDDETFYFKKLIYLAKHIFPDFHTIYPNIYKLINQLSILPNLQVKYDAITHLYDIKTVPWLGMCKNNIKV